MIKVDNVDISKYNFSTYLINNEYYMNIIFVYAYNKTILLIDYEGKLTKDLLSKLGSSYSNSYLNKKRFDLDYKDSLVLKNFINSYFQKEFKWNR